MFSIGTLSLRCAAAEALSSHCFCSHSLSFSLSLTRCSSIPLEFRVLYIRVNLQCDENTFDANICVWGDAVAGTRTKKCTFHVYQIVCMLNRNVFFLSHSFYLKIHLYRGFTPDFFSHLVSLNHGIQLFTIHLEKLINKPVVVGGVITYHRQVDKPQKNIY